MRACPLLVVVAANGTKVFAYFRHGVPKATFGYLDVFAWHRVTRWLFKRHKRITWADLYRRFLTGRPGNRPQENGIIMFDTATVPITRCRWRASNFPHRGPAWGLRFPPDSGSPWSAGCDESRTSGAEGGPGKRTGQSRHCAPVRPLHRGTVE
ncbi:group II intron maturase-specific domain-containing protein [Rhodococcus sp. JS3073]|uniref:group II intron maturase-specific domain-containing protein n=1 Tax=Rhodococcus sp. JS3073 TaxID=3002901 RepID=UPI003FA7D830